MGSEQSNYLVSGLITCPKQSLKTLMWEARKGIHPGLSIFLVTHFDCISEDTGDKWRWERSTGGWGKMYNLSVTIGGRRRCSVRKHRRIVVCLDWQYICCSNWYRIYQDCGRCAKSHGFMQLQHDLTISILYTSIDEVYFLYQYLCCNFEGAPDLNQQIFYLLADLPWEGHGIFPIVVTKTEHNTPKCCPTSCKL